MTNISHEYVCGAITPYHYDYIPDYHGPCWAYVVFIPGNRFSILNELTLDVTWLQMTRQTLHLYVGVAA